MTAGRNAGVAAVSVTGAVTAAAYALVTGTKIDTAEYGQTSIGYRIVETGGANGVTVKLRGSLDGTNWDDLTAYDQTTTIQAGVDVAISAGATGYLFVMVNQAGKWASSLYRYYSIWAKDTSSPNHGTMSIVGFAK